MRTAEDGVSPRSYGGSERDPEALTLIVVACEHSATAPADTRAGEEAAALVPAASPAGLVRTTWPSAQDPGPPSEAEPTVPDKVVQP